MHSVKFIRLERKIKAYELAGKAKITPPYLTLIESGRLPSRVVRSRIARALNLPIKALWPDVERVGGVQP